MFQTRMVFAIGSCLGFWLATGFAMADDELQEAKPVSLEIGDLAPGFEGQNDQGKTWTSSEFVGKDFLVIYFYPADFTTGCTRQAEPLGDSPGASLGLCAWPPELLRFVKLEECDVVQKVRCHVQLPLRTLVERAQVLKHRGVSHDDFGKGI
jgi:hypothetical protein